MRRLILGLLIGVITALPAFGAEPEFAADSALATIKRSGQLRVGFEAGYMPFQMIDQRGGLRQRELPPGDVRRGGQQASFIGFDIDVAREMAKALGVKFVPVHTRWTNIIPALIVGRFDIIISGMSVTPDRERRVDFAEPYMTIGQTVLLRAEHQEAVTSYRDLDDPNYVVASKPGTTGEQAIQEFMPGATYRPFDTERAGAMAVVDGTADAFVYDLPYNVVFTAMHGTDEIVFLDQPFTTEPIAWAIRKNDPDFLEWLNEFLGQIKAEGRYDAIYDKWFHRTDWFRHVR